MILGFIIRLCSETLDSGLNLLKPKVVTKISVLKNYKTVQVALNSKCALESLVLHLKFHNLK